MTYRKIITVAACLLSPVLTSSAAAPVEPSLKLDAVRVEITWIESRPEMNRLRAEYGRVPVSTGIIRTELTAFSVLGKRDGEYVCLIFAYRPRRVDDERSDALGHELAHCLLGDYHG